jgi:DNA primase
MARLGVSFVHAVQLLQEYGTAAVTSGPPVRTSSTVHLPSPVRPESTDTELLDEVAAYYHERLKGSSVALEYLRRRGIDDAELVRHFRLGYADRTLGLRLVKKTRKTGLALRLRLEQLGIYRASGHEHLAGSLVIPILSEAGHVLGMYGRKVGDRLRAGTPDHLYLPGPHRGAFNLDGIMGGGTVILCEALIDALSFWAAGMRNVTSSYGVEGFTKDHLAAFRRYDVNHVLLAYDADEAGDRAATALAERLAAEGFRCTRVRFPRGMDANEYACKVRPARKAFELLLKSAAPMTPAVARTTATVTRPPCTPATQIAPAMPKPPAAPEPVPSAAAQEPPVAPARPAPAPAPASAPPTAAASPEPWGAPWLASWARRSSAGARRPCAPAAPCTRTRSRPFPAGTAPACTGIPRPSDARPGRAPRGPPPRPRRRPAARGPRRTA